MDDDARDVELETLVAIYPELQRDEIDSYKFSLELPVSLEKPLTVRFPAATEAAPPDALPEVFTSAPADVDSQTLLNLPALRVEVALPEGYPHEKPPLISISTTPPWLGNKILGKLESDAATLWDENGHDQIIFTYIDDLQRTAEDAFGLVDTEGALEIGLEHKLALLDYDMNARRKAFERETFECGICLDPKKGYVCHKMMDCGHVFCLQCLQDFYNNAITEGSISTVTCLEPNCATERQKAAQQRSATTKKEKEKTSVSPSELLQMGIKQDAVRRYVMLKHKVKIESDKNTIYCPRSWCQGAARSKHKKPEGLELTESDDEDDEDTGLLAICEDCGWAFCSRCAQGWHGEFINCAAIRRRKEELTEEEEASLEYIRLHSTPCPTCAAPCQKTHGCNHMQCFRCQTHFCYLCSAWLDPGNPYRHYNIQSSGKVNACYMRLWELEGGDGDDVGAAYEGGDALRDVGMAAGRYGEHLEIAGLPRERRDQEDQMDNEVRQPHEVPAQEQQQQRQQPPQPPQNNAGPFEVAREGPLVLRIEGGVAPPRPNVARPAAPQGANAGQGRGQRGPRGQLGRGAVANQQNMRNRGDAPGRPVNNAPNDIRRRDRQPEAGGNMLGRLPNQLDPVQEAWVRQFVQLALNDEEDGWDSDD
ncbi:RWD-domain-containing protein, partial [Xylariaceae sp. FL0255]